MAEYTVFFSDVEATLRTMANKLRSNGALFRYAVIAGSTAVNAENLDDVVEVAYRADRSEEFGVSGEDMQRAGMYFKERAAINEFGFIADLHREMPDLDKERELYMRTINIRRKSAGLPEYDVSVFCE